MGEMADAQRDEEIMAAALDEFGDEWERGEDD
jgi:hypothetical protein